MNSTHNLTAFLSCIGAILALSVAGAFLDALDSSVLSAAITGLIGIAGTFRPRQQQPEGQ